MPADGGGAAGPAEARRRRHEHDQGDRPEQRTEGEPDRRPPIGSGGHARRGEAEPGDPRDRHDEQGEPVQRFGPPGIGGIDVMRKRRPMPES